MPVRVKCEMLDYGAEKCDLFRAHEALFSIKILHEIRIIDVQLLTAGRELCSNESKNYMEAS